MHVSCFVSVFFCFVFKYHVIFWYPVDSFSFIMVYKSQMCLVINLFLQFVIQFLLLVCLLLIYFASFLYNYFMIHLMSLLLFHLVYFVFLKKERHWMHNSPPSILCFFLFPFYHAISLFPSILSLILSFSLTFLLYLFHFPLYSSLSSSFSLFVVSSSFHFLFLAFFLAWMTTVILFGLTQFQK